MERLLHARTELTRTLSHRRPSGAKGVFIQLQIIRLWRTLRP